MNDFLNQFVIESRELVSQAIEGLLKLERSPEDARDIDAVFRAFHTLKGGAGIVEFSAMERAVHAAEEVLSEARAGQHTITPALVSRCLACLDQVSQWLDAISERGELPPADVAADEILRLFADAEGTAPHPTAVVVSTEQWVESLLARHPLRESPRTAIRYAPSVDCFFQGEDPAARLASLPQLLAQELMPIMAWPALSELDPYACNLMLMALSSASGDSVRAHMQGMVGECDIVDVGPRNELVDGEPAPGRVRELLAAQRALLAEDAGAWPGCIAAAGRVAANVLRSASRAAESRRTVEATEQSMAANSARPLAQVLDALLSSTPEAILATSVPNVRSTETTLRVDAVRIDALVRLTGELTTAKNALAHTLAQGTHDPASTAGALKERLQEFERLTERLQHAVLALRVLPLRSVLQRFPKVVRELSSSLGKPVVLQIEGDHTEADKSIVDMLFEPLLHAVRNAIDHGVESPARRMADKKPLVATLKILARRASDRVIIEVQDDGGGVDAARVAEVALQRQLVSAEALEAMNEAEVVDLIFAPGFSTAAAVSEISGRGVGLDAVRSALQRVGGHVSLSSRERVGTTLTFSLPFSVMVTPVLTFEAGGQTFGVPLDALRETLRVPRHQISGVGAARMIVYRDRAFPLIDLAGELGRGSSIDSLDLEDVMVVLAHVSDGIIALRVDRVGERIEVILKPLGGLLTGLKGIAGTTLLGDGQVLLVLDLWGLLA